MKSIFTEVFEVLRESEEESTVKNHVPEIEKIKEEEEVEKKLEEGEEEVVKESLEDVVLKMLRI